MRTSRCLVVDDADALACAAADRFVAAAREAAAARGRFDVCLCGGSSPVGMYRELATPGRRTTVDWPRVRVWFGDERCVPPTDEASNYGAAERELLSHVDADARHVFRMHGELDPPEAAAAYDAQLAVELGPRPRFDLTFLGLGDDGHTASLFPGTDALDERERRCVANHVRKLDAWRLTLTYPVLNASRRIVMLALGEAKAASVRRVVERRDPDAPATGIEPEDGELLYLLDRAAASALTGSAGA